MLVKAVVHPLIHGLFRPVIDSMGVTIGTVEVTTDVDSGTWYWVLTTSPTTPSAAQVKAGQDHLGVAAADSGNDSVVAAGVLSDSAAGLAPATTYYPYFVHTNTGVDSAVLAGSSGAT